MIEMLTTLLQSISASAVAKLAIIVILVSFLPLNAMTYQRFRSCRRRAKVERILKLLKISEEDRQRYFEARTGRFLSGAVAYASVVSVLGLAILLFGEHLQRGLGSLAGPDSWRIFGMGFLGGYLWGIQYVLSRYTVDDLNPGVYHALAIRMVLAGVLAVVIYNAYAALAGGEAGVISDKVWPALALVLGMFPQKGVTWLRDRIPFLAEDEAPGARKAPLEMIEGVAFHDRVRLEEEGIDNCYELATSDFVPLVINTPYSARTLMDWILQAKLCAYVPEAIGNLRQQGIRTILDLAPLGDEEIKALVEATAVTRSALERAQKSLKMDREVERLRHVGSALSRFSGIEDPACLHLVVGGKLKDAASFEFADYTKIEVVGVYPHHDAAHSAWQGAAQKGDAEHRYYIGHVSWLVDPGTPARAAPQGDPDSNPDAADPNPLPGRRAA
jgi:Domain of unknown function (DUF4170)